MARKSKIQRFEELNQFPNAFQCTDPQEEVVRTAEGQLVDLKDRWSELVFKNNHPIVVELACGKGEYTIQLAQAHPEKNFIGIDIKGNRMHRGAQKGLQLGLSNAAFLRIRIEWLLHHFAPGELAEIWITFPDPFLKASKENRRLTSPVFLEKYRSLLRAGGWMHLKTDSPELYTYTMETLNAQPDVYIQLSSENIDEDGLTNGDLAIQTYYESQHRAVSKKIKYIRWKFIPLITPIPL
jgi:tRNA (guanine-N7-)-methyltransferase